MSEAPQAAAPSRSVTSIAEIQSYISRGIMTTGHGLFCKEFLCFDTVPLSSYALTCVLSDRCAGGGEREGTMIERN